METPKLVIEYINYLLARDNEPIQFTDLAIDDDGSCIAKGTVEKAGSWLVIIKCTARQLAGGRILIEDIRISSGSSSPITKTVFNGIVSWMRDSILEGIRKDVADFGIVIDLTALD